MAEKQNMYEGEAMTEKSSVAEPPLGGKLRLVIPVKVPLFR